MILKIENLHVKVEGEMILKGVDLEVQENEVVAIMGPNGSGKSTLVNTIMGNEKYEVVEGDVIFNGESIKDLPTNERAKKGIFVSFQHPPEIEGVRYVNFLPMILSKYHPDDRSTIVSLRKRMIEIFKKVELEEDFLNRYINGGFSGGERKKSEIAQMLFVKPKLVLLDEVDSGLDVDALKIVADAINTLRGEGTTFVIITHYPRILHHVKPDAVHVLMDGKLIASGDMDLATRIEEKGYEVVTER